MDLDRINEQTGEMKLQRDDLDQTISELSGQIVEAERKLAAEKNSAA